MTPQPQATAKNGLTFSGTEKTVNVTGGNHRHPIKTTGLQGGNSYEGIGSGGGFKYTEYSGDLSMSGSYTPEGTISGDAETRPVNYTIKIWKRTA